MCGQTSCKTTTTKSLYQTVAAPKWATYMLHLVLIDIAIDILSHFLPFVLLKKIHNYNLFGCVLLYHSKYFKYDLYIIHLHKILNKMIVKYVFKCQQRYLLKKYLLKNRSE